MRDVLRFPKKVVPPVRASRPVAIPPQDAGDVEAMCRTFHPDLWSAEHISAPEFHDGREALRHKMVNVLAALKARGWQQFG